MGKSGHASELPASNFGPDMDYRNSGPICFIRVSMKMLSFPQAMP
jgi:hypothetical protein